MKDKINENIPFSNDDFTNIAELNSTIIGIHGLRNAIDGITNAHINNGVKTPYLSRYNNIVNKMNYKFYEDANQVRTILREAQNREELGYFAKP